MIATLISGAGEVILLIEVGVIAAAALVMLLKQIR